MAYRYKDVIYRGDFQAIASAIEDFDFNLDASGDCWDVLDKLLNKKDAQLTAAQAENEKLRHAATRALNYITNTESELGITLESGELLRAALAKQEK